jgi:hypothetical protein
MRPHAEGTTGPSGSGTVVLELGAGSGALILHVPAEMDGAEIHIGLAGRPGWRTHSAVRPRNVASGVRYAAVYAGLTPGDYTIWRDDGSPAVDVTVVGGIVTSAHWPTR